jgi:hypothetical protein
VIEKLTGERPYKINPIIKSPWAVIEMGRERDRKKLLKQQVVYDPMKNTLIVFRKPAFEASHERAFEIQNVKFMEDLQDLENALVENGSTIIKQSPPTGEWSSTYTGKIIWKTKAPSTSWKIPVKATSSHGTQLTIRLAPVCGTCHADDHTSQFCEWKGLYKGVGSTRRPKATLTFDE